MRIRYQLVTSALLVASTFLGFTNVMAKTEADYQVKRSLNQSLPIGLQSEQPRVEYIWPAVQKVKNLSRQFQSISSDYYYQVVSGEELNNGVKVYTSGASSLLRLAPKADYTGGYKQQSKALDMSQLTLTNTNKETLTLRQVASVEAMRLAGFNDGSIALRLPEKSTANPMILSSAQPLESGAQYLLQVKESQSPYKLTIQAANNLSHEENAFAMQMQIADKAVSKAKTQVTLLIPGQPSVALRFSGNKVKLPETLDYVGAANGLYELDITTMQEIDGLWVKRSAKVPFAQHVKTAQISGQLAYKNHSLYLPIDVYEPGRYMVSATLQGRNEAGKPVNVQTADVAQWMDQAILLRLPFNLEKFNNLRGPFSVVNVQLQDQSRMIPLQYEHQISTSNALY